MPSRGHPECGERGRWTVSWYVFDYGLRVDRVAVLALA
jgi:hypothetical protein